MKILKRALLLSFVSFLALSQGFGEDNKKSNDLVTQVGSYEIKDFKDSDMEEAEVIYRDLPDGRKNIPIKTYRKKIENCSNHEPVKAEARDYLTEIKDGLNKIFDLCLIIGGMALIFIILKILYLLSKYIDSLTIRYEKRKPANNKPAEDTVKQ